MSDCVGNPVCYNTLMTRTVKSEAIVLRKRSLLKKDTIVTLFTERSGKINVLAKGIKKITSRRLPHTETGNLINVILYRKDERYFLQETKLISAFSQIKKDQKKLVYFYLFLFILERLLPENAKEIKVYQLAKSFLVALSKKDLGEDGLCSYLNKLLSVLGYLKGEKTLPEIKLFVEEIINEKIPSLSI